MTARKISRSALIERFYPLFISVVATTVLAIIIFKTQFHPYDAEAISNVLSAAINFSAITVGFLVTTLSIMPSLENRQVVVNLKRSNVYLNLIKYIYEAIRIFLVLVLLSMFSFLIDSKSFQSWYYWVAFSWIFVFVLSLASYYRAISLFIYILRGK